MAEDSTSTSESLKQEVSFQRKSSSSTVLFSRKKKSAIPSLLRSHVRNVRRDKFLNANFYEPRKDSLGGQEKMTKRVIAPYVTVTRAGKRDYLKRNKKYFDFFICKNAYTLICSLRSYLALSTDIPLVLCQSAETLRDLTDSLGMRLYIVDHGKEELYQYQKNVTYSRCRVTYNLNTCNSVACYTARSKEFIMVNDVNNDSRFPEGVSYKKDIKAVLCIPIVNPTNCYAVIELYKELSKKPYCKNDLKLAIIVSSWISLTVAELQDKYVLFTKQTIGSDLFQMVVAYCNATHALETCLSEILCYCKNELKAEKGALYVITDEDNLLANIYEETLSDHTNSLVRTKHSVSLSDMNTVASYVARVRKMINIKNLKTDKRFKAAINVENQLISFEHTVLCFPVINNNILLGVISLINKADGEYFTYVDEELVNIFSTYMGLVLFHARAQRHIKRTELKIEHTMDILKFQLKPSPIEFTNLAKNMEVIMPLNISSFDYYILKEDCDLMPQLYIKMIRDLIPDNEIIFKDLYSFVLTVKRCYRDNPYHNFEHAFSVSQAMYAILIRNMNIFTLTEREALMIAALTHDIDHSGVTNNYLLMTNHRWAQLYEDSFLEHHHCFVTKQILKQYDLFCNVVNTDKTAFWKEVQENIMFTSLISYFNNRDKLLEILDSGEFNFRIPFHKYLTRSVCMAMADMTYQTKPFNISKKLTDRLYAEYYKEDAYMKQMGFEPLSTLHKECTTVFNFDQLKFVKVVAKSCAKLLKEILPNTEELVDYVELLEDSWALILKSDGNKLWRQCDSLIT